VITLDFETFYDTKNKYSLNSMTTEEYIRDPRFEIVGVSVQVDDAPAQWCDGSSIAALLQWLQSFNMEQHAVASHNAMFDMAILGWKLGIYPKMVVDTMSMAKAVHGVSQSCSLAALAKFYGLVDKGTQVTSADGLRLGQMHPQFLQDYADYCKHDTELCRQLFKILRAKVPTPEMMAIDWTIQCYSRPTLMIDVQQASLNLQKHLTERTNVLDKLGVTQEALRSDEIFSELLIKLGVLPPRKFSPKQKNADGSPKEVWAFARADNEFMDLLEDPNPDVVALVEARLANKTSIVETRLRTFVDIASRGAMPYPLAYASAQPTLRWQAWNKQKLNLQNLPRPKPGLRSPLRDAICAPPGYKMGVIDLSQIELRVNAWLSYQQNILDILASGGDVYCLQASVISGKEITKADKVWRFIGKTATLGCGYQCGGEKFTYMLRVAARREGFKLEDESLEFGTRVVSDYRNLNPNIVRNWYKAGDMLKIMAESGSAAFGRLEVFCGSVMMPDGMALYYPNLRWYTDPVSGKDGFVYDKYRGRGGAAKKWVYGGLFVENLCQRIARCVMRDAILRLRERFWVAGSVHDEAIFLFPEHENEGAVMDFATQCMIQRPHWAPDIPLAAEGSVGRTYGDCK